MKPLGMTPLLQVIHPTPTEDAVWAAAEAAVCDGWTFDETVRELREAWQYAAKKLGEQADRTVPS